MQRVRTVRTAATVAKGGARVADGPDDTVRSASSAIFAAIWGFAGIVGGLGDGKPCRASSASARCQLSWSGPVTGLREGARQRVSRPGQASAHRARRQAGAPRRSPAPQNRDPSLSGFVAEQSGSRLAKQALRAASRPDTGPKYGGGHSNSFSRVAHSSPHNNLPTSHPTPHRRSQRRDAAWPTADLR